MKNMFNNHTNTVYKKEYLKESVVTILINKIKLLSLYKMRWIELRKNEKSKQKRKKKKISTKFLFSNFFISSFFVALRNVWTTYRFLSSIFMVFTNI